MVSMGGKRRRSSGGNIRKKSRSSSKQILARVAERKEAAEANLLKKLQASETASRSHGTSALGILENASQPAVSAIERSSEEQKDPPKARYTARATAREDLLSKLSEPLFERIGAPQHKGKAAARKDNLPHSKNAVSNDEERVIDNCASGDDARDEPSLEHENHLAAAREKAQFDSNIKPGASRGTMKALTAFSGVGRISTSADEKRNSALEAQIESNMRNVTSRAIGLPPSVYAKWCTLNAKFDEGEKLGSLAKTVLLSLRDYNDLIVFRKLTGQEEDEIRRLYVAHLVMHVLRARARVVRNDAKLNHGEEGQKSADLVKDQGFHRARVLLLVPMKNTAYEVVKSITALAVGTGDGEKDLADIGNSERFEAEFAPGPQEQAGGTAQGHSREPSTSAGQKPADHRRTFRGNIDDDFKLGICFTRKSLKLFTDFYASDIIIASPLGLRRAAAERMSGKRTRPRSSKNHEEEDMEWKTGIGSKPRKQEKSSSTDDGFLSSIEICVIDSAHVFSMQNWDSLRKAVGMINKMPTSTGDTDFSRLRDWCLDGLMARFRQTVVFSHYRTPEIVSLVNGFANHSGVIQVLEQPAEHGTIANVSVKVRQTFLKVPEVDSPTSGPEKRFSFFLSKVLPVIRSSRDCQCLVFIPSYFDYVRVRNGLLSHSKEDETFRFASMCEYSKKSDVTRARARFYDRSVSVVLVTERFHFFWRHHIRGANMVLWYGLPENANYFPEVMKMMDEAAEAGSPVKAIALYDEFDGFRLGGVVGRNRCRKMVSAQSRSTYVFA